MSTRSVVPNISSDRVDESRNFYTDFLGCPMAMDLGWIVTLESRSNSTTRIGLLRKPASAPPRTPVREEVSCGVAAP